MWQVAGWILELDRGQGIPFEGNYSSWLDSKVCLRRIELSFGHCKRIPSLIGFQGFWGQCHMLMLERDYEERDMTLESPSNPQFLRVGRGLEGCLSHYNQWASRT